MGTINASVYRLWSDGVIEETIFDGPVNADCVPAVGGFGWQEIPETVPPPPARITRVYGYSNHLLRLRRDGVVERNDLFDGCWCGWRTPPE